MKFFKLIALISFLVIPLAVSAQKNKYIGYEYTGVVYQEKLPNGVKDLGGNLLANEDYAVSRMKKGKSEMVWLIKIIDRNADGVPNWKVKNVLTLPKIGKDQQVLRGYNSPCKVGANADTNLIVLADYSAKDKVFTPDKAWRINIRKNSFEEVSTAKISCKSSK